MERLPSKAFFFAFGKFPDLIHNWLKALTPRRWQVAKNLPQAKKATTLGTNQIYSVLLCLLAEKLNQQDTW
jgi:hypothetical protein